MMRGALFGGKDEQAKSGPVVLSYFNPINLGAVPMDRSMFQIIPSGASPTFPAGWTVDANGYAYKDGSFANWLFVSSLGAKAATVRMYQLFFRWEDNTPASGEGVELLINFQDGSNYWACTCQWTGTVWRLSLASVLGGVVTTLATNDFSTAEDWPMHFVMSVYDAGDNLNLYLGGYEVDVPGDDNGTIIQYSTGGRALKTVEAVKVQHYNNPGTDMRYRGLMVLDI